jgi:hypothetical protein
MYPSSNCVRTPLSKKTVKGHLASRLALLARRTGHLQHRRRSLAHIRLLVMVANVKKLFSLLLREGHL